MFQKYFGAFHRLANFFRPKADDGRSLMEKLRDKYRLVIQNDETFEEVASLKLSPLSVYVAISSLIVGTAILVTLLIIWTPLKRYIPGYGDFTRDSEVAELTAKVKNLEDEIQATRNYADNIRNIINGDYSKMTKDYALKQGPPEDSAFALPTSVERIPEDDELRSDVAKGSVTSPSPVAGAAAETFVARDKPLEQLYFVPPVSGEITARFDQAKDHFGVDVAAPKNTAVKAAADGMVISAGFSVETGYSIAVQHPNNVVTMYKHNSVLLKKQGSAVKAGEAIAIVGNTGEQSTGPHLHFELWYKGRPVDASNYINFK